MEKTAKGKSGNWSKSYTAYFWLSGSPFDAKYKIEKTTGILLERESGKLPRLAYVGSSNPPMFGCKVRFVFEAASPNGNWYSLNIFAWVPRTWRSKAQFLTDADRAFEYWTQKLQTSPNIPSPVSASKELYDQRVRESVETEMRLSAQKEDPGPIRTIQRAVLDQLLKGKSFRTAHHEGGTILFFDGKHFVRSNWGEEESREVFRTDAEMIDCIRKFYDWDSRKETYPHRPPELEVWKFIQRQLWPEQLSHGPDAQKT